MQINADLDLNYCLECISVKISIKLREEHIHGHIGSFARELRAYCVVHSSTNVVLESVHLNYCSFHSNYCCISILKV